MLVERPGSHYAYLPYHMGFLPGPLEFNSFSLRTTSSEQTGNMYFARAMGNRVASKRSALAPPTFLASLLAINLI